ncbi:MAG: hypothetical protein IPN57_03090 [Ignavibacteria bacterium]|nr:hypothetical protein [Ignavibacteria bacterium]
MIKAIFTLPLILTIRKKAITNFRFSKNLDRGAEFLINFINKDSAEILVDEKYSVYSDIYNDYVPLYASKENSDGKFVRQILLSNRKENLLKDLKLQE